MKFLRLLKNYLCYCGIEKDEYKDLKKEVYISNFQVWRVLHCLMVVVFAFLFISSLKVDIMQANKIFYLIEFAYCLVATSLFLFVLKKDSLIAQLIIYLSISSLLLFGAFITQNNPDTPATTFIVMLIIIPMFMIDKSYYIALELILASLIYLIWMYQIKTPEAWEMDLGNIIVYVVVGFVINIIINTIRVKEFVLTRQISIQKDTDDMTGLKNKGALTREINEFLQDSSKDKGIMFLLDINYFKKVNDTYGHDVGDSVINQLGKVLKETFTDDSIVGRFGGDEFIVFIKNTDSVDVAKEYAYKIIDGADKNIELPDKDWRISVSVGIAIYCGKENSYFELFKKADIALYKIKADRSRKIEIYQE